MKILVVGGGPSSRLFYARTDYLAPGILTFATGMSIKYFEELNFFPDFWAMTDAKVLWANFDQIEAYVRSLPTSTKVFLPIEGRRSEIPNVNWVSHCSTGRFAIDRSVKEGASKIFLIGLEGSYIEQLAAARQWSEEEVQQANMPLGGIIFQTQTSPQFNPNYWTDTYQSENMVYSKPLSDSHRRGISRAIYEAHQEGAEVINLSPISLIKCRRGDFSDVLSRRSGFGSLSISSFPVPVERGRGSWTNVLQLWRTANPNSYRIARGFWMVILKRVRPAQPLSVGGVHRNRGKNK